MQINLPSLPYIVTSKKAQATTIGVLLVIFSEHVGIPLTPEEKAESLRWLFSFYVGAQGVVDALPKLFSLFAQKYRSWVPAKSTK